MVRVFHGRCYTVARISLFLSLREQSNNGGLYIYINEEKDSYEIVLQKRYV